MTLDAGLMGMPLAKSGNLSERGLNLTYKRGSHDIANMKLSPFGDHVTLDYQKKVLKQQLLDHEKSISNNAAKSHKSNRTT